MSGKGGGSTGAVSYPTYMENVHKDWLGVTGDAADPLATDIVAVMDNIQGDTNPYTNATVYDPSIDISNFKTVLSGFNTNIIDLDPNNDWASAVDNTVSKANNAYSDINLTTLLTDIVTESLTDSARSISSIRSGTTDEVNTLMNAAIAQVTIMVNSAPVQDLIKQFQQNAENTHLRAISRMAGGFADINAVNSSAFIIGMAMMEAEHVQAIDSFTAQLALNIYNTSMAQYFSSYDSFIKDELNDFLNRYNTHVQAHTSLTTQNEVNKATLVNNGAREITNSIYRQMDLEKQHAGFRGEVTKMGIIAESEYWKQVKAYDVEDWLWNIKVFQYGSNVLSGIATGGQVLPESVSQLNSTISGVASGAAIGMAGGVPGVVIGAAIGGIGGFISGGDNDTNFLTKSSGAGGESTLQQWAGMLGL